MARDDPDPKRPKVDSELAALLSQAEETQGEIDKVSEDAMNEILKVEQKYAQLKRPLFTSRNERLSKIPGFWPTAIKNHPILHQLLCPMDEEILNNLVELDIEDFPDIRKGFKIVLRFTKNKFFENTELTKTMEFNLNAGTAETKCTPINWHDGQESKVGDASNLFMWFITSESLDDSTDEVAAQIRDSLWPDALRCYKGDLLDEMPENFEMIGDDDDDEDDEQEGDDADEEDAEDEGDEEDEV